MSSLERVGASRRRAAPCGVGRQPRCSRRMGSTWTFIGGSMLHTCLRDRFGHSSGHCGMGLPSDRPVCTSLMPSRSSSTSPSTRLATDSRVPNGMRSFSLLVPQVNDWRRVWDRGRPDWNDDRAPILPRRLCPAAAVHSRRSVGMATVGVLLGSQRTLRPPQPAPPHPRFDRPRTRRSRLRSWSPAAVRRCRGDAPDGSAWSVRSQQGGARAHPPRTRCSGGQSTSVRCRRRDRNRRPGTLDRPSETGREGARHRPLSARGRCGP